MTYLAAVCQCRVCGHREVAVYPSDIVHEDNQECGRCHAMASEPLEYIGPDGERRPA
jgi:hypothetical protein